MKNPFQVGGTYHNERGEYEVVSIDGPTMAIRWTDGSTWEGSVALQARILKRRQQPPPPPPPPRRARYSGLAAKAYRTPNVAVFSRNHGEYLQAAASISAQKPRREITFRARSAWKSAASAVEGHGPCPLYYLVAGERNLVRYEARLCRVLLDPKPEARETQEMLKLCLPETQYEGTWEGTVNTLYTISSCRELTNPFPYTDLTKVSDGRRIAENFGYSYSIVLAYCQKCQHSPCLCSA